MGLYTFIFGYLFKQFFIINFISIFIKPIKDILTGIEFNTSLNEKLSSVLLLILLLILLFVLSSLLLSLILFSSLISFSLISLFSLLFSNTYLITSEIKLVKLYSGKITLELIGAIISSSSLLGLYLIIPVLFISSSSSSSFASFPSAKALLNKISISSPIISLISKEAGFNPSFFTNKLFLLLSYFLPM